MLEEVLANRTVIATIGGAPFDLKSALAAVEYFKLSQDNIHFVIDDEMAVSYAEILAREEVAETVYNAEYYCILVLTDEDCEQLIEESS
ncbi:MAG: hypothetical protein ACTSO2_19690 [Promethearchaeota archaeon]